MFSFRKSVLTLAAGVFCALGMFPSNALAASGVCTHGSDWDAPGFGVIRVYEYQGGEWKYIGSTRMHVHSVRVTTALFGAIIATENWTVNCSD